MVYIFYNLIYLQDEFAGIIRSICIGGRGNDLIADKARGRLEEDLVKNWKKIIGMLVYRWWKKKNIPSVCSGDSNYMTQ